jgi:hypothetical protein
VAPGSFDGPFDGPFDGTFEELFDHRPGFVSFITGCVFAGTCMDAADHGSILETNAALLKKPSASMLAAQGTLMPIL